MNFKPLKWLLPIGIAAASQILWDALPDPEQSARFLYLTFFGAVLLGFLWIKEEKSLIRILPEIIHWKNSIFVCIMVWLTATILSLPITLQKSEGYVETSRVAFFLLSYVWVSAAFRTASRNTVYLSVGFCITGFMLSAIGLNDFLQVISKINASSAYYQMGNMGNRNLLAIMVSLCLPFHFILLEHYKPPVAKIAITLNLAFCAAVVMLTNSRVGWLGIAVMLIACGAVFLIMSFKGIIRRGLFIKLSPGLSVIAVAIVIPLMVLLMKNPDVAATTEQRLKSFVEFNSEKNIHTESINERFHIWRNSVQLIKENPLTGVGAGNWKFRYAEKGLPDRAQRGSVVFLQPHNDFLWVFSETGIIGGTAFLALFALGILLSGRQILAAVRFDFSHASVIAAFTGTVMYAIHSFFDFPKERPLISFTFACILAMIPSKKTNDSPSSARILIIALLALSLILSLFWIARIRGEMNMKKAIDARQSGNFSAMKKHLDKINPKFLESDLSGIPIDWYRSELAYLRQDRLAFKKYSESSIRLNPYQLYNLYNLGSIYYKDGDIQTAIRYWEKAVSIAPRFADAAVNLSAAYYNQKNYSKAAELLSKPSINFQNESHRAIAATVLGKYINLMSDTINMPELKTELRDLSVNPDRVKNLQSSIAATNRSLRDAAISEAIHSASETTRSISAEKAKSLKSFYGL